MSEITYKIFHERTAENIKVEIQKLHDLLIVDNKKNRYQGEWSKDKSQIHQKRFDVKGL
jgi:hypothetical protein